MYIQRLLVLPLLISACVPLLAGKTTRLEGCICVAPEAAQRLRQNA